MAGPEFSVIMPAYRAPAEIGVALRSIQGQSVDDLEVIVVDDGSGDSTPDIVREFAAGDSRIKLIEQENAGTAAARNRAIEASGGRILALLDNDDAWLHGHLDAHSRAFAANPGAGLAFSDAYSYNQERAKVYCRTSLEDRPPSGDFSDATGLLRALGESNFVIASGAAFTREAYDAAGPFDPAISGSDDWDMWLRIAVAGFGGARAGSTPSIVLRDSQSSQSKDLAMILRTSIEVLDGVLSRPVSDPAALEPARRTREDFAAELAAVEGGGGFESRMRQARTRAAQLKGRVLDRRIWRPPPTEVTEILS